MASAVTPLAAIPSLIIAGIVHIALRGDTSGMTGATIHHAGRRIDSLQHRHEPSYNITNHALNNSSV
jgi:hypothetical protein